MMMPIIRKQEAEHEGETGGLVKCRDVAVEKGYKFITLYLIHNDQI